VTEDFREREDEGLPLGFHRSVMRGLEDDLEGRRRTPRRSREDAIVGGSDDAFDRVEAIDDRGLIHRQRRLGGRERRFHQMLGHRRAAHESVNAVARVIGVQRDDAVEFVRQQFALDDCDFRFERTGPELTIQK